jgi:prevent-host-death family protein
MIRTNAKEARQHFSHLLDQVENGEEVFILRRGNIIAHIVPYKKPAAKPLPSLKEFRSTIKLKGLSLSEMIIKARAEE